MIILLMLNNELKLLIIKFLQVGQFFVINHYVIINVTCVLFCLTEKLRRCHFINKNTKNISFIWRLRC